MNVSQGPSCLVRVSSFYVNLLLLLSSSTIASSQTLWGSQDPNTEGQNVSW